MPTIPRSKGGKKGIGIKHQQPLKTIRILPLCLIHSIFQNNKWEQVDLFFQLPVIRTNDYIFALYLWNTGNAEVLIDDPEFGIYE